MATPAGNIGLSDVNAELRNTAGTNVGLNDSSARALARVPSGDIGLSDLQGKSILSLGSNGGTSDMDQSLAGDTVVAQVSFQFNSNGTITISEFTNAGTVVSSGDGWSLFQITGLGDDYQVEFTGSVSESAFLAGSSNSLNTFHSLSSAKALTIQCTANEGQSTSGGFVGTIKVRESANTGVSVSADVVAVLFATNTAGGDDIGIF